jgi:hypothetical protein
MILAGQIAKVLNRILTCAPSANLPSLRMQDSTEQNQPRTMTDNDIVGLKYFDQLGQLLQQVENTTNAP